MHFVDEKNDLAALGFNLRKDSLEAFFEFTTVFGARDECSHVQPKQALVLKTLGHVAIDDAQGQTLGDSRLADARFADKHGIVFRTARKHLDRPADFFVAADDRIELAVAGSFCQVARIALECIIGLLSGSTVSGTPLAHGVDRLVQDVGRCTISFENF